MMLSEEECGIYQFSAFHIQHISKSNLPTCRPFLLHCTDLDQEKVIEGSLDGKSDVCA